MVSGLLPQVESRGSSPMSFLRREDALDLPNVIDVVTGEHPHDNCREIIAAGYRPAPTRYDPPLRESPELPAAPPE